MIILLIPSRWYPGGGIYRNVWLVKTDSVHVGQWAAFIRSKFVSEASATLELDLILDNDASEEVNIEVMTSIFKLVKMQQR